MPDFQNFRFEIDADGIALATWDMAGRSMNVITPQVIEELAVIVDTVADEGSIKGCVVTSGKDELLRRRRPCACCSALRAEHRRIADERGEEEAMRFFFDESRKLSLIYRRLETCGKPFAAAVHGTCLGGAFELALACHFRVLSDAESTRVGLPEIKVGLFPGAGGTQRVARLMPTGDALQMLFKGEQIRPQMARRRRPRPCARAAGRPRRGGEGLDQAQAAPPSRRGIGRISGCPQQGPFRRRHADLDAGERHLPARDAGQLSGSLCDPRGGLPGPAAADGPAPCRSSRAGSPRSCAPRRRRR